MISKVIPRKKQDGTSERIKDLVAYLLKGDKHEKVSAVVYHGVVSDETAVDEMKALASLGSGDPLYHFVISWPEDESPSDDQSIEAARMMVQALVDAHNEWTLDRVSEKMMDASLMQYIMAVHRDTKYSHIHVLLNKRDPESWTLLNIWKDYLTRDKACRQIELKQGWRQTPGYYEIDPRDGFSLRRSSHPKRFEEKIHEVSHRIEEHTGEKSFIRWIQEEVSPLLETAESWSGIHEKLSELGLEFQEVRRGLVLTDGFLYAKASSCGASYARPQLEKRWGRYQPRPSPGEIGSDVSRLARKEERAVLRNILWEEYKAYRNKSYNRWIKNNKHDWQLQRQSERERRQQLLNEKRVQHASILSHNWRGQGEVLKALRAVHAAQSVQKKLRLQQEIAAERQKLKGKYSEKPFRSWREFCETRAKEGRREAISAWRGFRYRDRRKKKSAHQLLPEDDSLLSLTPPKPFLNLDDFFCFIHEDGQVDYFDRKTQILSFSDHGDSVHVFQEQDDRVLEAALRIGIEKWGRVQVKGDEAFKERIYHMAVRIRAEKKVVREPFSALDALRGLLSSSEDPVPPSKPSQKPSAPPEEEAAPRSSSSRSSSFKP